VTEAAAAKIEKVNKSKGELARFLGLSHARNELLFFQDLRLRLDSFRAVVLGELNELAEQTSFFETYERRRRGYLAIQASLTDFRIFWDTMGQALRGRDMVLIDSETVPVPGQRNLLLFDPEIFRLPPQVLVPPAEP
jgi:hypothetical protein